ncbi:hypothetical protein Godav_029084, partial [Gossypium davidsonii]|nr:hypothetical protein [Gossypium davidsonii]
MFGSREYLITGVFYSRLKQRYLGISIPFPLHRLPVRCHMNPILRSQILTSKTLKQQPFLTSFDSGIPSFHPRLESNNQSAWEGAEWTLAGSTRERK